MCGYTINVIVRNLYTAFLNIYKHMYCFVSLFPLWFSIVYF